VSAFLAESQAAACINRIPYAAFHPCATGGTRRALLGQARERGYHVTALCVHPKSSGL
jgi:hypothetical protein